MTHCEHRKELTDHLNAVAENILKFYTAIDTREIDEMLFVGGSEKPWRHRYLVGNRLKAQGWRCYYALKKDASKGYLFFWLKAGAERQTLEEYCDRHGGRPNTLEVWRQGTDDENKWLLKWSHMIAASKDLTNFFFGWRDYCRAQYGSC